MYDAEIALIVAFASVKLSGRDEDRRLNGAAASTGF
jgi:hypothetical protein